MSSHTWVRIVGATLIVAGINIGAAMIALPLSSAYLGFTNSMLLLLGMWIFMSISALIGLEINLRIGKSISMAGAAKTTFGRTGQAICGCSILILLYSLLAAYTTGGSSLLREGISNFTNWDVPYFYYQILFASVLSFFIYARTKAVDIMNRLLFTIKMGLFISLILFLAPFIQSENLITPLEFKPEFLLAAIPVFFVSFGFHGSIPTLVRYLDLNHKELRFAFIVGSFIPLAIYFGWELVTLGVLPLHGTNSFSSVFEQNGDVAIFVRQLNTATGNTQLTWISNAFTAFAIATSFLGVGIGLFDYIAEIRKGSNSWFGRFVTLLITMILPVCIAIYFPQAFLVALGFGAVALSIIAVIMPSAVILKLRKQQKDYKGYQVMGGNLLPIILFILGIGIVLIQFQVSFSIF